MSHDPRSRGLETSMSDPFVAWLVRKGWIERRTEPIPALVEWDRAVRQFGKEFAKPFEIVAAWLSRILTAVLRKG